MKILLIMLCIYTYMFSDCKIVNQEEDNWSLTLNMMCTYKLGESEALMDAKNNLFYDAKLKTKNKVGEIVISKLKSNKLNVSSRYILEQNTDIISPSIVKIDELSSQQNANIITMNIKTTVDKSYIVEYEKKIENNVDIKQNDDLSIINETLPDDALMREAIFKEKAKKLVELDNNRSVVFDKKSKDNIVNSTYKINLKIDRKIIEQHSYIDNYTRKTFPWEYEYKHFQYKTENVESIFAKTKTDIIIDTKQASKLRGYFSSTIGLFSNKIGKIDIDSKYKKIIQCNNYNSGLSEHISVVLEFEGDGDKKVTSVEIGDCIDFSIIEENRNIAKFHPVKLIGFEITKSQQELIEREKQLELEKENNNAKDEAIVKKHNNDKMFTSLISDFINNRWKLWNSKSTLNLSGKTCNIYNINIDSQGNIKPTIIKKSDNAEYNSEADKFIFEISKVKSQKYNYKSPSEFRELDSDNLDIRLNLCLTSTK